MADLGPQAERVGLRDDLLEPRELGAVIVDARAREMAEQADEADAAEGRIGWGAPLARALIGARVGDERTVRLPAGEKSYEILSIRYPD